ncbi:MAG: alanine racemase [Clostridia bacterium]|nr:alanine racemase [Clostridia bacterium]
MRERVWAEIRLGAAASNYRHLERALRPGVKLCPVVKAEAYGHGAAPLALLWERMGAASFAVATLAEGERLRAAGVQVPILILGPTDPSLTGRLIGARLTQGVHTLPYAEALAGRVEGAPLSVHIKLDTGMGRLGFSDGVGLKEAARVCRLPPLQVTGIYTHFSSADTPEGVRFTEEQATRFSLWSRYLEGVLGHVTVRHCAASAAALSSPSWGFDMVRPGIALYGVEPRKAPVSPVFLHPCLTLKSTLVQIHELPKGAPVGYGGYRLRRAARVGVVSCGYGDGIFRAWGEGRLWMSVGGKKCPTLGRVCMDLCFLDLSHTAAEVGDEVTVLGGTGPSACEAAERLGTIPYEILTSLSPRVGRYYLP